MNWSMIRWDFHLQCQDGPLNLPHHGVTLIYALWENNPKSTIQDLGLWTRRSPRRSVAQRCPELVLFAQEGGQISWGCSLAAAYIWIRQGSATAAAGNTEEEYRSTIILFLATGVLSVVKQCRWGQKKIGISQILTLLKQQLASWWNINTLSK